MIGRRGHAAFLACVLLSCSSSSPPPGDGSVIDSAPADARNEVSFCSECELPPCDGVPDFDYTVDPDHCGGCGHACDAAPPGTLRTCADGVCGYPCDPDTGLLDCNSPGALDEDGCEVDPGTDPEHCGACNAACAIAPDGFPAPRFSCMAGECGQRIVGVSAGEQTTCVTLAEGLAYCWGANSDGQLGDGATVGRSTPAAVGGMTPTPDIAMISAYETHTCEVLRAGSASCHGAGSGGELGGGSFFGVLIPTPTLPFGRVVEIATGHETTVARTDDGGVFAWGAIRSPGAVFRVATPEPRLLPARAVAIAAGGVYVSSVSIAGFACAALETGDVYCWGTNGSFELGDGTTTASATPVRTGTIDDAVAIGLGARHGCAVSRDGAVRCWGSNDEHQCGVGPPSLSVPAVVTGMTDAVAVDAGRGHSCALRRDGSIACWGASARGQLGMGATAPDSVDAPTAPLPPVGESAFPTVSAIAVGANHTCAIAGDSLYCWGDNAAGQSDPSSRGIVWRAQQVTGLP